MAIIKISQRDAKALTRWSTQIAPLYWAAKDNKTRNAVRSLSCFANKIQRKLKKYEKSNTETNGA